MIEIYFPICYSRHRKGTHSKVDAPKIGLMPLRTPPHLLADRWGIFISSCSSYRERQETQQSSFSGGCHPVMGTFLMAFAMLFIIPFMCAFFNSFSTNLCADSLLLFTPNVINLSFLQRKFIIWHYELLSIFQHRIWFNFLKLMTLCIIILFLVFVNSISHIIIESTY